MFRFWYLAAFVIVTGVVFGALVGFDKIVGP
jgi:hypothetical protein